MSSQHSTEWAIEVAGLTKSFRRHPAVCDLTLRIPRGTAFGFLGPNGAGKTTTLRMLMGLLRRDSGRIGVLGLDPVEEDITIKQRVGYVPEQQFIYRWMRVRDAVRFCRPLYPTWNDRRCDELLTLFGLEPGKKVKHLSKGSVVKLALLLAMSHEPDLLILDEPMAGLDPLMREELLDGVLRTLCDREQTVVFSSHTMADVQRLADRVGIIDEGRLIIDAGLDDLLTGTKRIRAVLVNGSPPTRPPDGTIWQRVADREWLLTVMDYSPDKVARLQAENKLDYVEVTDLNLEDIFKDCIRGRRTSCEQKDRQERSAALMTGPWACVRRREP